MRVGFVGLGIMGQGMARNLLRAGFDLVVWNRTAARMDPLEADGARPASDPADVARQVDATLVCVSDTPDVEAVVDGPDGLLAGAPTGALIVDTSTISPDATRAFAARAAESGVDWLDAPVSGGSEGAERGTLSIMVGGEPAAFARAAPLFAAIGDTVTHVGPAGSGQATKLVNQILVTTTMLGVSEALVFAQAQGLDLDATINAVVGGAAGSWMLANRAPQVVARDWRPGFTIDLQQKDLRLVLEAADAVGAPLLATATVAQLYRTLQRAGLGGDGNHALVRAVERLAGFEVGDTAP